MSSQEYQGVGDIVRDPKFAHDLFVRFKNALAACCEEHYDTKFTRATSDDHFLLQVLETVVAQHSGARAANNSACLRQSHEQPTEDTNFLDNWFDPSNPITYGSARCSTLFPYDPSPASRAESVRRVIANVDQQLPEDTPMPDPCSLNQPQQLRTQPLPLSTLGNPTASNSSPQPQQVRTQPFCLAQAGSGPSTRNHTSESGESSGAQSDNSFASSRKQNGKRVAGRHSCQVEGCPKKNELMQKCRLEDHMALHDPSRRTQCPTCGKTYMHSRTCNDHHKKAHGMDLKTFYEMRSYQYAQEAANLGDLEGSFTEEEGMGVAN